VQQNCKEFLQKYQQNSVGSITVKSLATVTPEHLDNLKEKTRPSRNN